MKNLSIFVLLILVGCSPKETFQTQFPIPIADYYYEINGNKTHFIIEFQQPIPNEIKVEKLYFLNQYEAIKMLSNQKAEAIFIKPDLILDANTEEEYGNQAPIPQKQRFQINYTEAVLEFTQNNKIKHYKFTNITEKSNK